MKSTNSQRNYLFKILVYVFLLTGCSSATPEIQSVQAIPTKTVIPTTLPTETSTPTPTPTEFVIPEFMDEYLNNNYDKTPPEELNSFYAVNIEGSDKYFPQGKKFKGITIFGITNVARIIDGEYEEGWMIFAGWRYAEPFQGLFFSGLHGLPAMEPKGAPSINFFKAQRNGIEEWTQGDFPIIIAMTGSGLDNNDDRDRFFADVFTTDTEFTEIPGIGKVWNITKVKYP